MNQLVGELPGDIVVAGGVPSSNGQFGVKPACFDEIRDDDGVRSGSRCAELPVFDDQVRIDAVEPEFRSTGNERFKRSHRHHQQEVEASMRIPFKMQKTGRSRFEKRTTTDVASRIGADCRAPRLSLWSLVSVSCYNTLALPGADQRGALRHRGS